MQTLKLVVIGDGAVGKSCFLIRATTNSFPSDYVPTVFDNYSVNLMVNGSSYNVGLWDTAGQEDYDRLRPLSYPKTDVFVVCFDVGNRNSFQNVSEKWVPEVLHFVPEAPILLLATKIDLRSNSDTAVERNVLSYEEGKTLALNLGITYAECSSVSGVGVQTALDTAVRLAVQISCSPSNTIGGFLKRKFGKSHIKDPVQPPPPQLPPAGFAPRIEVTTSSFASDWYSIITDSCSADVVFLFHNGQPLQAHRIVLCAASSVFKNILLGRMALKHEAYSKIFEDVSWTCTEGNNCSYLDHLEEQCKCRGKTLIMLDRSISHGVFKEVVTFLYTGLLDLQEDEDKNFVNEIKFVAEQFQLSWLIEICNNLIKGNSYLNPSIGTWLNDNTGLMAKKLFLNKALMSDVKFRVEATVVYAHKAILRARSEVMAAMFCGRFRESDDDSEIQIKGTSLQGFLALMEYLYTDHAPIEEGDSVEIMVLADRFCLPRLVTLCELYITKRVDVSIQKRVVDGASDVMNLLLTSQAHNAMQLAQWCLHFISTNFSVFQQIEEFNNFVQGENRTYVEEHQWPPLSYLKDLEEYEKKAKSSNSSSKCRVM